MPKLRPLLMLLGLVTVAAAESVAKDKYDGRYVAVIHGDFGTLNARLLEQKFAKPYDGGRKAAWTAEELKSLETEARYAAKMLTERTADSQRSEVGGRRPEEILRLLIRQQGRRRLRRERPYLIIGSRPRPACVTIAGAATTSRARAGLAAAARGKPAKFAAANADGLVERFWLLDL